ncbi:MAG TPA: hypothetical protein VMT59_08400 [Gaiellaceae bacterium]|nr:hypothetical protein [Gaiellaceae bacterium]
MDGEARLQWNDAAWLAEAHAWILAELGDAVTGPIEQPHVRAWSTVLRVPTDGGPVWFKANMPVLSREAAIVSVLARRRPDCVPELLAADLERGWMLQADGGTRLREAGVDAACWKDVLPLYAGLQLDTAEDRTALLEAGAPDRTLAVLPTLYDELVAGESAELCALTPRVEELCAELAGLGLPETVQHDDLHDGQIFVRDGRYRFFDWAEACVSHPFFTMTVTLQDGLERFRDAYLEPWTRIAPREELEAAFPTALVLGGICRALTWRRVIDGMPEPFAAEWADMVPNRLQTLLAAL